MTLIKSISGIRGTIGGLPGEGLTPLDIVKFTAAYGQWLKQTNEPQKLVVVVGRDARTSGKMVAQLVITTLNALGLDVVDLGLATTPTVEMAVTGMHASGGIIITASHNPVQWNALKLLNHKGEFISEADGQKILELADDGNFRFAAYNLTGKHNKIKNYEDIHIEKILKLKLVNKEAIKKARFTVVYDAINSVGAIAVPKLLKALSVKSVTGINKKPDGIFMHNPEPLDENVGQIKQRVCKEFANVGFVVDPDVDRLAIICEDGTMFGEEYTLVAVADYVLSHQKGNTVSNLSSSRALRDIAARYGVDYHASAVGEVNVVEMMKKTNAIIGGEGNGGIIYPELHYGRDALVGIALFLSLLAERKMSCSQLRKTYPDYYMSKNKVELKAGINPDHVLKQLGEKFRHEKINLTDGLKIDFNDSWVHLRKSNTEPIIRIYTEAPSMPEASQLAGKYTDEILKLM